MDAVVGWIMLFGVGMNLLVGLALLLRRRVRFQTGRCTGCGYSLEGIGTAGRCPECGHTFGSDALGRRLIPEGRRRASMSRMCRWAVWSPFLCLPFVGSLAFLSVGGGWPLLTAIWSLPFALLCAWLSVVAGRCRIREFVGYAVFGSIAMFGGIAYVAISLLDSGDGQAALALLTAPIFAGALSGWALLAVWAVSTIASAHRGGFGG